jgi:hypothetical protein
MILLLKIINHTQRLKHHYQIKNKEAMAKLTIEIKIDQEIKDRLHLLPMTIEMDDSMSNDVQIKELYMAVLRAIAEDSNKK